MQTDTAAEYGVAGPFIGDLAEASDVIARELIHDIDDMIANDFPDPNAQISILFGNIENNSQGTITTGDIDHIREGILDILADSDVWKNNVSVRRSAVPIRDLNRRERGGSDLLKRNNDDLVLPNLAYEFYLDGNATGTRRGSTFQFTVRFMLHNAQTGVQIFRKAYSQKYQ